MKLSKSLIFKVNKQKYAIKTKNVINVVENVKLLYQKVGDTICNVNFNFNGINIPFVNFHNLLGTQKCPSLYAECVLIAEVNVNGMCEIIGISIDEITEVTELEDFISYPFIPISDKKPFDFREAIILYNNEPIIVLNSNKIWSRHSQYNELKKPELSVN